jgi:hypothetical protein
LFFVLNIFLFLFSGNMSIGHVNDGARPSNQMNVKEQARAANLPFWMQSQRAAEEKEMDVMDGDGGGDDQGGDEDYEGGDGDSEGGDGDSDDDDTTDTSGERTDGAEDDTTDAGE